MAYDIQPLGIGGGLVKDVAPSSLGLDEWSTAHNLRVQDGWLVPASGHSEVFESAPVAPQYILGAIESDSPYWYYAGGTKIYQAGTGTHVDVSRVGNYTTADVWNGTVLNDTIFFNNNVDQLQIKEAGDAAFKDSVNFPATLKAKVVRGFKNFLFALNLTDGATNLLTSLRWSDPADAGVEPPSWDVTDPTTQSGQLALADTDGYIVDALQLNDQLIIYKTDSVYTCSFIGGQFVFSFRKLFDRVGMLSQNCATSFDNQHFVVGFDDIYIHDGVQQKSVSDMRVKKFFYKNLDQAKIDSVFVVSYYQDSEVWVCYPDDNANGLSCNQALVWNWETDQWSSRDLPDVSYIASGIIDPNASDLWDAGIDTNWDDGGLHWDANRYSPANRKLLMASAVNTKFYEADNSVLFDTAPFEWVLEKESAHHGDPFAIKFLNAVVPEVVGSGTMSIRTGSQLQLKDGISWNAPRSYEIGEFKHYARNRGRYVSYRLSGSTDVSQPFIRGFQVQGTTGGEK